MRAVILGGALSAGLAVLFCYGVRIADHFFALRALRRQIAALYQDERSLITRP